MNESVPSWVRIKRLEGERKKAAERRKLSVWGSRSAEASFHHLENLCRTKLWNEIWYVQRSELSCHIGQGVSMFKEWIKRTERVRSIDYTSNTVSETFVHLHWDCCQFQTFIHKYCSSTQQSKRFQNICFNCGTDARSFVISRFLLPLCWSISLTWSFCGSLPPVAWYGPPWIQFSPASELEPFADGRYAQRAQPCRPLGNCPQLPPKGPTGSLVTDLQRHCCRHDVHSKNLEYQWDKDTDHQWTIITDVALIM